ncbi:MAG: hypothetical protein H0W64_07400 [Gammaproteobacteria bacterium]|nr:hypothetical protein [Gammaproteobacteria bacterium]
MIIAAFLWNTQAYSISTLLIDQNFNVISAPNLVKLNKNDFTLFKEEAKTAIETFFKKINHYYFGQGKVKIERRIVLNPAPDFIDALRYQPTPATQLVHKVFLRNFRLSKEKIEIVLEPQLQKKLSGKTLTAFRADLLKLNLIEQGRNEAYQCHLWTVALHATPSNYKSKIARLKRSRRQSVNDPAKRKKCVA